MLLCALQGLVKRKKRRTQINQRKSKILTRWDAYHKCMVWYIRQLPLSNISFPLSWTVQQTTQWVTEDIIIALYDSYVVDNDQSWCAWSSISWEFPRGIPWNGISNNMYMHSMSLWNNAHLILLIGNGSFGYCSAWACQYQREKDWKACTSW